MMSTRDSKPKGRYSPYEDAEWRRKRQFWPDLTPETVQTPVRRRPQVHRRRSLRVLWIALAVPLALFLLGVGIVRWYEWTTRDRVVPHVFVANVDIGGLTPEDAEAALRLRYDDFQTQPVVLIADDRVWRPTGEQLGMRVNWTMAIDQAMAIGRTGSWFNRLRDRFTLQFSRHDILLPVNLDEGVLQAYLEEIARTIDVPPLDASLAVEDQLVSVRPGRDGRTLKIAPSVKAVEEALQVFSQGPVTLTVDIARPEITDLDAQAAMDTARRMLTGPLIFHISEKSWTLTVQEIGAMLKVERRIEDGRARLTAALDQETLREFVVKIANEVRVRPRNAHFRFIGDHLEITDEGSPGQELQVEAAMGQINEAATSANKREIELNTLQVVPTINRNTIAQMGIKEVVGVGESHFYGSADYRTHNIVNAANIIDGALIPPGGEFSFLDAIGPIDEEHGFVQGYGFEGGRTVLVDGGGVCQVSTTIFRAAFFAGVPITERHAHDYRVSWYEQGWSIVGLDATIYSGTGTDLRFQNDTPGYLLMQFEVNSETGDLYVYLYGTRPNREVQLDGPYQDNWVPAPGQPVYDDNPNQPVGYLVLTESALDGLDVTVYRQILVNGQVVSTDTFFSRYQARPNRYERGTGNP